MIKANKAGGFRVIRFIINRFIKEPDSTEDNYIREQYCVLSGILGIGCNLLLFVLKLTVGLVINSIAVLSDAFNNLSDLGSSLIVIIGIKLSNQPPDDQHPHGHGRLEYIGSLIMSFVIVVVGLQLIRSSIGKITNPEIVNFNALSLVILVCSVIVKLWMFSYNRFIGRKINSSLNRATAVDSLNDALATGAVILGVVLGKYTDLPLDGIIGLAISLLIIYTGFSISKSSINLLLGASPDPELVGKIDSMICESASIISSHDLRLHDYGPGRIRGSIHAVVPKDADISEIHYEIDQIEQRIKDKLRVDIVIHVDPIDEDLGE